MQCSHAPCGRGEEGVHCMTDLLAIISIESDHPNDSWTSLTRRTGCYLLYPVIKSGFLEIWYNISSLFQRYGLVHTQIR